MKYLDKQFEPYDRLEEMCSNDGRALSCISSIKTKKKYEFVRHIIKLYFLISLICLVPIYIGIRDIVVCLGVLISVCALGLVLHVVNWVNNSGGKIKDLSYLNWYLGENAFNDMKAKIHKDDSGKEYITIFGNRVYLGNFYFPNYQTYVIAGEIPVRLVTSVAPDGRIIYLGLVMGVEDRVVIWKDSV